MRGSGAGRTGGGGTERDHFPPSLRTAEIRETQDTAASGHGQMPRMQEVHEDGLPLHQL